jgi:hypothetical protein
MKTGRQVVLSEREKFILRLSIVVLTAVPLRFSKKRILTGAEQRAMESAEEKLRGIESSIVFTAGEAVALLYFLDLCRVEEFESIQRIGKSVGFQNYLSSKFGAITLQDFEEVINRLNEQD